MLLRRCAILLFDSREKLSFDFETLISGGEGLRSQLSLLALAPHLGREVEVSPEEIALISTVSPTTWTSYDDLAERFSATLVDALLATGLLLKNDEDSNGWRALDEQFRAHHWWTPAAVAHYFGRWDQITSEEGSRGQGFRTMTELVEMLGAPPPHIAEKVPREERLPLPRQTPDTFDEFLDSRVTCRNFDTGKPIPLALFSTLIERVFGARGSVEVRPDATVIKRTSPSGGGLHPTEAYLLVQRVEGVAPGLYHYHPIDHALEPLSLLAAEDLSAVMLRAVAGQEYYAEAHVMVILVSRFSRTFWKYRNHTKAYRVVVLDAGHLSQTLYLSATQAGLGAFVTGAINEVEIETMFGLDRIEESPVAVCGFGWRAANKQTVEFDPLQRVWPSQIDS